MQESREHQKTAMPLARTTLTAAAFEQLVSFVLQGEWKPGDRIPPERELCQQLGIARTSLREALKAMELIGMLDSKVGDGTFVCPHSQFLSRPLLWALAGVDRLQLGNMAEARSLLEKELAALAAERATSQEVREIEQSIGRMRDAIALGEGIGEADVQFHLAVAEAAHNPVLRNAVQLLLNLLGQFIGLKLMNTEVAALALEQHESLLDAIRARDAQGARDAMAQHVESSARLLADLSGASEEAASGSRSMKAFR